MCVTLVNNKTSVLDLAGLKKGNSVSSASPKTSSVANVFGAFTYMSRIHNNGL